MFNLFLRGHLLTKKFFTFFIGSTFFTNKNKFNTQNFKQLYFENHIEKISDEYRIKKEIYFPLNLPLTDANKKYFNNIDFKHWVKFLLCNFGVSMNCLLGYLNIFRKISIMRCEIPKNRKPYLGCSIRANEEKLSGMKIILIKSDSPAEKAGLKVKDIILEIDGKPIRTINEYNAAIGTDADKKKLKIARIENQKENFLVIEVEFSYMD